MDLKQLRYFSAIVDHGSFRKAADVLHISPPALSLSIKGLEEELGVSLLDRKPGRVLATSYGHSLYNSARDIRQNVQSALDQLNEIRGIGNGRLAVGILPYGIPSTMGQLIGRFCDRYPNLEIQIRLGSFEFLMGQLKNGALDILVTEVQGSMADKNFAQEPLFRLRYGLVVGHKHPLAGKRNLSLKRVMEYRLAYARTWPVVLENWDRTFIDEGLDPPDSSIGEATDEFFKDFISHCNTVAVMPMIGTIKDGIESGQLAELHVPKIDWASTVALVSRTGEALSPDARLLRDETRTAMHEIAS